MIKKPSDSEAFLRKHQPVHSGMDWLDLLVVQGTLKNLLHHHSSKASNFWCSAYFMGQLSVPDYWNYQLTFCPWSRQDKRAGSRVSLHFLPHSPLLPHPILDLTFTLGCWMEGHLALVPWVLKAGGGLGVLSTPAAPGITCLESQFHSSRQIEVFTLTWEFCFPNPSQV